MPVELIIFATVVVMLLLIYADKKLQDHSARVKVRIACHLVASIGFISISIYRIIIEKQIFQGSMILMIGIGIGIANIFYWRKMKNIQANQAIERYGTPPAEN